MKRQQFNPASRLVDARRYLEDGRPLLALDIAGQVEHWLNNSPLTLETEGLRLALVAIQQQAFAALGLGEPVKGVGGANR